MDERLKGAVCDMGAPTFRPANLGPGASEEVFSSLPPNRSELHRLVAAGNTTDRESLRSSHALGLCT